MYEKCSHCELPLEREPGFYLGSVYFNYLADVIVTITFFFGLTHWAEASRPFALAAASAVATLFPIAFFRYARALWLFGDFYFDRTPQRGKLDDDEAAARLATILLNDGAPACVCPFCHQAFPFAAERNGQWSDCPRCRGKVLLVSR